MADATGPWRLAVLTTGRQDYGILRSTLLALRDDERFALLLYVGGMHLSRAFGHTVDAVRADQLPIARELDFTPEPPDDVAEAAAALQAVGNALRLDAPDALLLLGDRSETLAAGVAAALARVPVAHLHGGEETEGALDNMFRHALTKLSQLHLVSHRTHADRVCRMGEHPARVIVVGAPGLDHLYADDVSTRAELERRIGRRLTPPVVLVTVHANTLSDRDFTHEARAVAEALDEFGGTVVVTGPNSDRGGDAIRSFWESWIASRPQAVMVSSLGDADYWGLMREADAMVGNSSSGIIEAPAVPLPVINVGDRQSGRLRGAAVTDVPAEAAAIGNALRLALAPEYRAALASAPRLYPAGKAAPRIVDALAAWLPDRTLRKPFHTVTA